MITNHSNTDTMNIEEQVFAEAKSLLGYLYDDVENIFLPPEEVAKIDLDSDDWQDEIKERMSPIEWEWFDLIDDIQTMVEDFLAKNEQLFK